MLARIIFSLTILIFPLAGLSANANEGHVESWVKDQAFNVAKKYAESIACETSIDKKKLISLRPWRMNDDADGRSDAKYALIWHGDIGCNGGTGSYGWYISIIEIGAGDNFYVNPLKSSPMIRFPVPIKPDIHIVKVSKGTITANVVEEVAIDEKNCCNYVNAQILLKEDKKGNWYVVNKKLLPNSP